MNIQYKMLNDKMYYDKNDACKVFLYSIVSVFLFSLFISAIAMIVCGIMHVKIEEISNNAAYLIPVSVSAPIAFSFVYYFYNRQNKIHQFAAAKVEKKINIRDLAIVIAMVLIAFAGFYYFSGLFEQFLEFIGYSIRGVSLPNDNAGWLILNIFVVGILPAITEELIFRGIIFNGLKNSMNVFPAMLLSSVMFALMHLNVQQFIYPFILGLLLSFVVYRSGNVVYSMIMHFVNNFVVILVSFIYNTIGKTIPPVPNLGYMSVLFSISLMLIAFVLIYLLNKLLTKKDVFRVRSKNEKLNYYFYIGVAICVVAIIVELFVNIFM